MKYGKGERIKRLREAEGLTQVQLADIIGVKKQNLYKYENDIITNIPTDKVEKIADALNTSPAYIMGWSDTPYKNQEPNSMVRMPALDPDEKNLLDNYTLLNDKGQTEAQKQVKNLTYIPEYTQEDDEPVLMAARNDNEDPEQYELMMQDFDEFDDD